MAEKLGAVKERMRQICNKLGDKLRNPENNASNLGHILYIDAFDSFANNIIDVLERTLNAKVTSVNIHSLKDEGGLGEFLEPFDAIVLGPGPGTPLKAQDIGIMKVILEYSHIPILGICLGFQTMCHHFGARIEKLPQPKHGMVVPIHHNDNPYFYETPDTFDVTLYHSLQVKLGHPVEESGDVESAEAWEPSESCPELQPIAWYKDEETGKGICMGVKHTKGLYTGFQFHPESCAASIYCRTVLYNWAIEVNIKNSMQLRPSREPAPTGPAPGALKDLGGQWCREILGSLDGETDFYAYRALDLHCLDTGKINELVNDPSMPSVVLESGSRYSIISASSPTAFTIEYSIKDKCLTTQLVHRLRKTIHYDCSIERAWDEIRGYLWYKRGDDYLSTSDQPVQNEEQKPPIPFWGGFLGFVSYEMGLDGYNCQPAEVEPNSKDLAFLFVDRSIVIDKKKKTLYIQSMRLGEDRPGEWIDLVAKRILQFSHSKSLDSLMLNLAVTSDRPAEDNEYLLRLKTSDKEVTNLLVDKAKVIKPTEADYKRRIEKCQEHIRDGDSYELCLTAETKVILPVCPEEKNKALRSWLLYKRLHDYNPGAYSGYLRLAGVSIVSSSPELFLGWDRGFEYEMKPMKGTVKKTKDMTLEKAKEILYTPKEVAENLMIADLIRNDMTYMLKPKSTWVDKLLEVEDHGRVYQMITHVRGLPQMEAIDDLEIALDRPSKTACPHDFDPLKTTLPPGSMTGAPKQRSCQLLANIENRQRGVYSGVMGYLDLGGGGSFSVIIRTAFCWHQPDAKEEVWRIGAGGAVTALSTPEGEWQEMITKLDTVLNIFKPSAEEEDVVQDRQVRKSIARKMLEVHRGVPPEEGRKEEDDTGVTVPVTSSLASEDEKEKQKQKGDSSKNDKGKS